MLEEASIAFSDMLIVASTTACIEYVQETFDQLDNPVFLDPIQLCRKFRTKTLMP